MMAVSAQVSASLLVVVKFVFRAWIMSRSCFPALAGSKLYRAESTQDKTRRKSKHQEESVARVILRSQKWVPA